MPMNSDPRLAIRDGRMTSFQLMVVLICVVLNMVDGFDVLARFSSRRLPT